MTLGMWDTWATKVRDGLPFFATSPLYVDQDDVTDADVDAVVSSFPAAVCDPAAMTRDVAHGGKAFQTSRGPVTRMWVDGMTEIAFLHRAVPEPLMSLDVLDIGAGYGRLAVLLAPFVRSYTCVDAVDVSVDVCRTYTQLYAPTVRVLDMAGLDTTTLHPTLAINVHSWNECPPDQIVGWLDRLEAVPYLFTVSHDREYSTWGDDRASFKPIIFERYVLILEEHLGLGQTPHALWERRAA